MGQCRGSRFVRLSNWLDAGVIAVAINVLRWFATYGDAFDHSALDRDIDQEEDGVQDEK